LLGRESLLTRQLAEFADSPAVRVKPQHLPNILQPAEIAADIFPPIIADYFPALAHNGIGFEKDWPSPTGRDGESQVVDSAELKRKVNNVNGLKVDLKGTSR
jgi:hypothetical protein